MLQNLVNNFVRPPRWNYSLSELGPSSTEFSVRTDSAIHNSQGMQLQYSYYENREKSNTCVVYAHCNSGSRMEGLHYVDFLCECGWNVILFDFAGCGLSDGEKITLGERESADLAVIIAEARRLGNRKILLWGRSMGASTILKYLQTTPKYDSVCACILDSPFSSLWQLAREAGENHTGLPSFLVSVFLSLLDGYLKKTEGLSMTELDFLPGMNKIQCPLMFIASNSDRTTGGHHSQALYDACRSPKLIQMIDQGHNDRRSSNTIMKAILFLRKCSDKPKSRLFFREPAPLRPPPQFVHSIEPEVQSCMDCRFFQSLQISQLTNESVLVQNPLQMTFRSAIRDSFNSSAECFSQLLCTQPRPRKRIFG